MVPVVGSRHQPGGEGQGGWGMLCNMTDTEQSDWSDVVGSGRIVAEGMLYLNASRLSQQ